MKKNFYYLSLLLGLVLGMTMFTACGGDDGGGSENGGGTSGGDAGGFTPGKFMGPKRVFGDNLLSSYGGSSSGRELTYDSNGFVTSIKNYKIDANNQKIYSGNEYKVSYSGNQVIVTYSRSSGNDEQYTFTIGNNGFAESWTTDGKGGAIAKVKCYYDSDGHLTQLTVYERGEDQPATFFGTFTWQNGNMVESSSDDGTYRTYSVSYNSTSNVTGLFIEAHLGGDMGDFFEEEFYYIGLLGKGTANLVSSSGRSGESTTYENSWTLDAAGRPTKCVTTTTESGSGTPTTSTYFWTYR